MDRKVLIYSATEHFDDMPVGDKDDDEESRLQMKQVVGTFEQWKKGPWLFRVFRGWKTTQLYRDYDKAL